MLWALHIVIKQQFFDDITVDDVGRVTAPAYDVTVSPRRRHYAVNDVITCSAKGFPIPVIQWIRHGSPGTPDGELTRSQPNLTVTEEMIGKTNDWTCTASNELSVEPQSVTVGFTVTGQSVCLSFCPSVCPSVRPSIVATSDKGGGKCVCPCLSVCLSVCLLARLLKNACMNLDEMLHVDRCRDIDELINF